MPVSVPLSRGTRNDLTSMGTVLVVEDALVSKLVRVVLLRHGYQVDLASPQEAASILAKPNCPVQVLVTNKPEEFLEFSDRVPLLYLTSAPDPLFTTAFRSCCVVMKPFIPEELVRALGSLLGA
jgi:CheY-like chemotaxis protein